MVRWKDNQNGIKAAIPYLFMYDVGGNQTFGTATETFHEWDTIRVASSHFNVTAEQDRIYLNTNSSGLFKVTFECSFITYDEDDDLLITSTLYKNGTELEGSETMCSVTGGASQADKVKNSKTITYIVFLEKDDYIQVESKTSANEVISLGNTSRLIIEFIPMQGWNNSSGGREQYSGGVMR